LYFLSHFRCVPPFEVPSSLGFAGSRFHSEKKFWQKLAIAPKCCTRFGFEQRYCAKQPLSFSSSPLAPDSRFMLGIPKNDRQLIVGCPVVLKRFHERGEESLRAQFRIAA
jgi:hypothetical protein